MKKIFLLSFVLIISFSNGYAQVADSIRIKALTDSMSKLYARYFELEKAARKINNIEGKINNLDNLTQSNSERLNGISEEDKTTRKTQYASNKGGLLASAKFIEAASRSLGAFELSGGFMQYSNFITALNNPTNEDLGFNLTKEVTRIVDDKILKGKAGRRVGGRFRDMISKVINNPIVGVVGKTLMSVTPGVSSLTSVFNMVNNFAVTNEDVNLDAIKDFTTEMQKYVMHYENLGKAGRELDQNLNGLKVKTMSLRALVTNFVRENVADLYGENNIPNLDKMPLNEMINKYFNFASVLQHITQLETETKMNHNVLLTKVRFPYAIRTRVAFVMEEIEKTYTEQLVTFKSYNDNISEIMTNATSISNDATKIKTKLADLENNYRELIRLYNDNVQLENVRDARKNVPR
ncbi:MAG: hypothetical protein EAZ85_15740 [Bacteroidetes bacterium]|nr:MAG: hypothetical protein EAZ85_15740 [Bacteroidota bacterium]TAG93451.1 MAG: hypothetical protein EAZ20_01665 [Bacteroidota bacterium]